MPDVFDVPESMDVSNFISAEGQFLFVTKDVDEAFVASTGSAGKQFACEVLCGTAENQEGKQINLDSYNPQQIGDFQHRIRGRIALAHQLIPVVRGAKGAIEADPNIKGKQISIDWQNCQGRLWVGFVKYDPYTNAKGQKVDKYKIDGAHIYHIDDVAVKHVVELAGKHPMGSQALKLFRQGVGTVAPAVVAAAAVNGGAAAAQSSTTNGNGAGLASAASAPLAAAGGSPEQWKL